MNFKRSKHDRCVHKGKIYVCGGKDASALTCCERLETSKREWCFKVNMNVASVGL